MAAAGKQSHDQLMTALCSGVAMLLAAIATSKGPGLSVDSVGYLSTGITVAGSHGLRMLADQPLTIFPPGLPIIAAFVEAIGLGAETTLRIVSVVSFGAIVALGSHLLRRVVTHRGVVLGSTGLLAVSPTLLGVSKMAWSEPPFIVVTLLSLLASEEELSLPLARLDRRAAGGHPRGPAHHLDQGRSRRSHRRNRIQRQHLDRVRCRGSSIPPRRPHGRSRRLQQQPERAVGSKRMQPIHWAPRDVGFRGVPVVGELDEFAQHAACTSAATYLVMYLYGDQRVISLAEMKAAADDGAVFRVTSDEPRTCAAEEPRPTRRR